MSVNRKTASRPRNSGLHSWDYHLLIQEERNLIRFLREICHWGYEDIGRRCGVHGTTVKKWEKGKIRRCSPKHFKALEACFNEMSLERFRAGGKADDCMGWHCHLVLLQCFRRIGEVYHMLRSDRTETRRIVRHVYCALTKRVPHRHILSIANVFNETLPSAMLPLVTLRVPIEFTGEITKEISVLVHRIRDELGVGRRDLAAVMGVTLYSVRNWENCETKRCRNAHIEILNAFLNRHLDAVLVDHHHYSSARKSVPKMLSANLRTMLQQAMERSSSIIAVNGAIAEYLSRFVRVMHDVTNWGDRRG